MGDLLYFSEQGSKAPEPDDDRPSPAALMRLAWAMRQRDTRRALALAKRAVDAAPTNQQDQYAARSLLIAAEASLYEGRLEEAIASLESATQRSSRDPLLEADAELLRGMVFWAQGRPQDALSTYDEAASQFQTLDRAEYAEAYASLFSVYVAPDTSANRLEALAGKAIGGPATVLIALTRSILEFDRGNHVEAIRILEPVVNLTERLGMLHTGLRVQNTIAAAYSNLGDKDTAITWVERSLEQARAAGKIIGAGEALSLLGNFYREAGHHSRAIEMLSEARTILQSAPRSRGYALACCYLAHANLAAGANELCIENAREAEDAANAVHSLPIVVDVLTVAARARARLGNATAAASDAHRALEIAEKNSLSTWEVDALRALAEIYREHDLPPLEGVPPEASALHWLNRALRTIETLAGHAEHVTILRELSRSHEVAGDLQRALQLERQAFAQAASDDAKRISNRLSALEIRNQLDRERLEASYQRDVATAEAERAKTLAQSLEGLQQLSTIGRELTAQLDATALLSTLQRHVRGLAYAERVAVAIHDKATSQLIHRGYQAGSALRESPIDVNDPSSLVAQCFRTGREVTDGSAGALLETGSPMQSRWYGPLEVEGERLGVLTIQSLQMGAFGERERLMFQTLAAYVAIALSNATAYKALDSANEELREVTKGLRKEQQKSDALLLNILPAPIAEELKKTGSVRARRHEEVTVLFSDFSGFTNIASTVPAKTLVSELSDIFCAFDEISMKHGVEKIKTVGDAYMAAAGVPVECDDHALRCIRAATEIVQWLEERNKVSAIKWPIRIGLHSGPVVAGVVGRNRYSYDLWGDTVNIAARLEAAAEIGRINLSAYTYALVQSGYECQYRGKIEAKGKGAIDMYYAVRALSEEQSGKGG